MDAPIPFRLFVNPRLGTPGMVVLPESGFRRAMAAISAWPGYAPTELRDLPEIAAQLGIGALRAKLEQQRFAAAGVGSFKALGGSYAVELAVAAHRAQPEHAEKPLIVTCASAGNHGRAVAWGAQRAGIRCVVFVHTAVDAASCAAIRALGAELRIVPGTYDDAIRAAAASAAIEGWTLIADTSWPGYTEVPRQIMQGYRLMAEEAVTQWGAAPPPTHVFFQAGVGGGAAAVSAHLRTRLTPPPRFVVVEPEHAACLLASAEAGELTDLPVPAQSTMIRLACTSASLLAWQELERASCGFMAIADDAAESGQALLESADCHSTRSGAAGLAGLACAAGDPAARAALGLDAASRVLIFVTE